MILAVRVYLNKQGSKASITGLCLAMNEVLHARNIAEDAESAEGAASAESAADAESAASGRKITSVSTRTA